MAPLHDRANGENRIDFTMATLRDVHRKLSNYLPAKSLTESDRINQARELIRRCERIERLSRPMLEEVPVGLLLKKFRKHPDLREHVVRVMEKFIQLLQAAASQLSPRQYQALQEYRTLHDQYKGEQKSKPDMIAFKELRNKYVPERRHGEIPGVPVGLKLQSKGEAAILGSHCLIPKGIDAMKETPCFAICVSGLYKDDVDATELSGVITYTGCGGQDKKGVQVSDQKEDYENESLIRSYREHVPVRVLRKMGRTAKDLYYIYDGLYDCIDYKYEPSLDGPKVYKFILRKRNH